MSEELEGCALLLGCVLHALETVGKAPSSLGGADERVSLGFGELCAQSEYMGTAGCQQWAQGMHARLCEGVPDPPSPGPQQAASPPLLEFPWTLLLVVQGCVVWSFSPSLSSSPAPPKSTDWPLLCLLIHVCWAQLLTFLKKKI